VCEEKQPHDFQDRSARHESLIVQKRKYKKQWGIRAGEDSLLKALLLPSFAQDRAPGQENLLFQTVHSTFFPELLLSVAVPYLWRS
jgi:hypothetical protein